ncbi:atypical chemokine receptor 3 [Erinaceus europaeus]|uniref:Atypical chemokine receptor 3 n=1 Tax=Erinaceus europaeus TaxID=9365 RepID=A0A1S3AN95_ERIEU|nr:atypical chemokine receptor 3 [Erinaceus europaeus]
MDLPVFDYAEPGNLSGLGWPCNSSDCISVDTLSCPAPAPRAALLYGLALLYVFIFLAGALANAAVLWAGLRAPGPGADARCYVLNLAVADLCVVVTVPLWTASLLRRDQWPLGRLSCQLAHLLFSVNLFCSIFLLAAMSLDRYLAVARPPRRPPARRLACGLAWLLAVAVSLPDTVFLQTVTSASGNETFCRPLYPEQSAREWLLAVELLSLLLGFAGPFCVIAASYCLLARALAASPDAERRGRRLPLAYVLVFALCWLPYRAAALLDVALALHLVPFSCRLEEALLAALHVTQCLSLLHCCVNPLLYGLAHRAYRYELMKAFIFKYSAKTGLARLMDASRGSDAESSVLEPPAK